MMISWRPWGKYAIVSFPYVQKEIDRVIRQKGYSISKAIVNDSVLYELWELPSTWLGKFKTVDGAKEKAEELKKLSTSK